jgi:hypothetical protein
LKKDKWKEAKQKAISQKNFIIFEGKGIYLGKKKG